MRNSSHCRQTGDGQKDSFTAKAVKKEPHAIREEGRRNGQIRTCTCRRGHRRWGYMGSEILPGDRGVQITNWTSQTWGPTPGRWAPLAGLETSGTYRRGVRPLDSALEEHTHTCLLLGTVQGKQVETAWGSGWFPVTTPAHALAHTMCLLQPLLLQYSFLLGWRFLLPRGVSIWGQWRWLRPCTASKLGKAGQCWSS